MRRGSVRFGAILAAVALINLIAFARPLAFANERTVTDGVRAQDECAASPSPAASPVARDRDPVSGAPEVGIGRATGNVKSSGDEGGTAAGMPGKGPASGH